jgi:hypothetical protein
MSIRAAAAIRAPATRACQAARIPHRSYSQDSRVSGRAVLKDVASRVFSKPTPRPDAPKYEVLSKAGCEKHDEQLWIKELKKASEEFKKVNKKD